MHEYLHQLFDTHLDTTVSLISASVYILLIFKTRFAYVVGFTNQGFWYLFMELTNKPGLIYSIVFFAVTNIFGFIWWTLHPPMRKQKGEQEYGC